MRTGEFYEMTGLLIVGAVLGLLAVGTGAFAAHALKEKLSPDRFATFQVGAQYQMYHALAIVASAALVSRAPQLTVYADVLFIAGILLFSGSLYALSLTRLRRLGVIAPLGGLCFMAGWAFLIAAIAR